RQYVPDQEKTSFLRMVLDWGLRFRCCVSSAVNAIPYHPPKLHEWKIYQRRVPGPKFGPNQQTEAAFFLGRADSRNALFNFMLRLTERRRQRLDPWSMDRVEFNSLLEMVWRSLFFDQKLLTGGKAGLEATRELIVTRATEPDYATLQLNLNGLIWRLADAEKSVFRCNVCGRLSHYSVAAVCPVRWCRGSLVHVSQQEVDKRFSPTSHYRRLIRERDLRPLRVEEHTAEIANQRRLEIERLFKGYEEESVDVISGSTTFELGVDLGTISSVFLANLPPRVANYRQRAGRAGRREGMIPFVLSYVRQRPHDQYFWRDLKSFVSGPIPTPKFKLASEIVLRRHGFSTVLSFILKEYARAGRPVGSQWGPAWKDVSQFMTDPQYRAKVHKSANDPQGQIAKAVNAIYERVAQSVRSKLTPSSICDAFYKQIGEMKPLLIEKGDEGCIKVLGDYGILPTYSFPIYVDELRLNEVLPSQSPRCDLALTRDRRISLREYYPGNTITAGKTQIRSKGIWDGFKSEPFKRCSSCGEMTFGAAAPSVCGLCTGPCVQMQAVIPWGGYYGSVMGEGTPPEVELEEAASGEVIFDPANDPKPSPRSEGKHLWVATVDANIMRNARMRQFSPRPGSKNILQLQRRTDVRDVGAPHSPTVCLALSDEKPSGSSQAYYLMHEFTTDILRLRIMATPEAQTILSSSRLIEKLADAGPNSKKQAWFSECFWQTLAEALLIASSKWLDVDDTANAEIGVAFRKEAQEPCLDARELILYDTAPGGAGYASEVAAHLREVFQIAVHVLNGCSCGDSCYQCIRSYRNQWIHSRLDRHLVAEGLQKFVDLNWR
ncbi:MAG: Zn-binding domain-containing protein, partial [Ktedonobacteraceae bacterium]